nr:bifunctional metallophosphatase/5'-nucleotidase [Cytophagales bacterium]
MDRREFLQKSLAVTGALSLGQTALPTSTSASPSKTGVCIIHTNDLHSRIHAFPDDGGNFANQGGMAKLSHLVAAIRKEEDQLLLLDAGDIFQGTPYFNIYGGEVEFRLMSLIGYDASTLGNHDFDNGLEGFYKQLPHATFPFINSNYDFSRTLLANHILPYKLFKKGSITVGVFGLGIELKGLVPDKSYGNTNYLDPVGVAKEMVQELRRKGCHLVVCLSHLGFAYKSDKIDDKKLARQVEGIDAIIGGHTHSFLERPVEVIGPGGHVTVINQAGRSALRLGRLKFEFEKNRKLKTALSGNLAIK